MELPTIGQQCSQADCKQLDFLPLHCKCGKQFCSHHFNMHVKSCETFVETIVEPRKITDVYKCSHVNCSETSIVPLICEKCNNHFCIKHRHLTQCFEKSEQTLAEEREKYNAPVRQFNEAKVAVDKQIEENLNQAKKKGKNTDLVNKVQLMKIKNKAKGLKTVPISDRVYFNVHYSKNNVEQVVPIFVSQSWSVGRAIDVIADECSLVNHNNKAGEKKLRLFTKDSGMIIAKNVSEILQNLLRDNAIVNGADLVIGYVDEDCVFIKQ